MSLTKKRTFFYSCLLLISCNTWPSDALRERQYAIEILRDLHSGSAVYLGENQYFALYNETETAENRGTAILLHDAGQHPDSKPLIYNLRTQLPEHLWATLSLQLPVYEYGIQTNEYFELFPEVFKRIQAAIDYLQKSDVKNIALIGYGMGGLMAVSYAFESKNTAVKAIVAISLPAPETEYKFSNTLKFLRKINLPLLDIYGSADIATISSHARKKRIAAKHNPQYRQVMINETQRPYQNYQQLLVKRIYSWLIQVSAN
jgi:predicted esterase